MFDMRKLYAAPTIGVALAGLSGLALASAQIPGFGGGGNINDLKPLFVWFAGTLVGGVFLLSFILWVWWRGKFKIIVDYNEVSRTAIGGYTISKSQDKGGIFIDKNGVPHLRLLRHGKVRIRTPIASDIYRKGHKYIILTDFGGVIKYATPNIKFRFKEGTQELENMEADFLIDERSKDMTDSFLRQSWKPLLDPESLASKLLMYTPFFLGFIIMLVAIIFAGQK